MGDRDKIILGSGVLYLNGVDVGHLTGEVVFENRRKKMMLSPSGSSSTNLVGFNMPTLRASMAEFSVENLRLALGLGGSINASSGQLSYDPSSYSFATSSTSWEGLTFGNDSLDGSTISLRFEHAKIDGKKVVVILYTAISLSDLELPFSDTRVTMYDISFMGIPDQTRPNGDQVGIIFEES